MKRAAWRGYISLGRLGIPVRLYSAVHDTGPRFVTLHELDGSHVNRLLWCQEEQKQIDSSETVRAAETSSGNCVMLSERELQQAAASPLKSLQIEQFGSPESIPTLYYKTSYYIVPVEGGERAYALLRDVLAHKRLIAIARIVLFRRERLATINVYNGLLVLQQLHFSSEIIPRSTLEIPSLPASSMLEVQAMSELIERNSMPFFIEDYRDEYSEKLSQLVAKKEKGQKIGPISSHPAPAKMTPEDEILSTIRKSLAP